MLVPRLHRMAPGVMVAVALTVSTTAGCGRDNVVTTRTAATTVPTSDTPESSAGPDTGTTDTSGPPETTDVPDTTDAPTATNTSAVNPIHPTAIAGTRVAHSTAAVVDEIPVAQLPPELVPDGTTSTAIRVMVRGPFQVRSARLVIYADGVALGSAVLAPDLRVAAVVLADDSRVGAGTTITYGYEGAPKATERSAGKLESDR